MARGEPLSACRNGSMEIFGARHVAASDDYYAWYADQELGVDQAAYHLCTGPRAGCRYALPRNSRRERWRLINPLLMAEIGYSAEAAVAEMKDRVQAFVPKPVAEEPAPQSGLDQALAEAAAGAEVVAAESPPAAREHPKAVPAKGSVGALLRGRAEQRREQLEDKDPSERSAPEAQIQKPAAGEAEPLTTGVARKVKLEEFEVVTGFSGAPCPGRRGAVAAVPKTPGQAAQERDAGALPLLGGKKRGRLERGAMGGSEGHGLRDSGDTEPALPGKYRREEPPRLMTLGTSLDHLLQGRLAELGDLLMQRLKALETSLGDQGWATARHQELIPPLAATLTSTGERESAAPRSRCGT